MGEFTEQRAKVPFDPEQGGPVVRVRGFALMGSVQRAAQGPARRAPPQAAGMARRLIGYCDLDHIHLYNGSSGTYLPVKGLMNHGNSHL